MKFKVKREVKIGAFALAMLLLLYWGINFLKGRDLFNRNNVYYATYEQLSGVQPSSAIVINGFKVGSVSKIDFDLDKKDKITLELTVKNKYRIPANSMAHIYSDGLLGGKGVKIELGDSEFYLNDGDTLRSSTDKDFMEVAGSEFEFFKQKADALINQIMATLATVNKLLENNTESITATTANIADITGTLRDASVAEKNGLDDIVANLGSLTAKLNSSADKLDGLLEGAGAVTDSLAAADIPQLVRSLTTVADGLTASMDKINSGEGTAGKLIADPALYDSLAEAGENLNKLIADIKANPGRYVSISVFGRKNK